MYFTLWSEKVEGKGEDAPPTLLFGDDQTGLLAVYDGLGGSGSKTYLVEETGKGGIRKSSATLASSLAKETLEKLYEELQFDESFVETLEKELKHSFDTRFFQLDDQSSKLKSRLIRNLPTTLAGIFYKKVNKNELRFFVFWAGDSRCYLLNEKGCFQLSQDDLVGNPDAMENLYLDAPLSNCIQAGNEFTLNCLVFQIKSPSLLIAASDGCFSYLESPVHFEHLLLHTLMNSYYDFDDWKDKLYEALETHTADDLSLSLVSLGYPNLNYLKNQLYKRYLHLQKKYILPVEKLSKSSKNSPAESETYKKELLYKLWEEYKPGYYSIAGQQLRKK